MAAALSAIRDSDGDDFQSERDALDPNQVAEILHRSPRWVRSALSDGVIPVGFRIGRTRYVYRDDLREYMNSSTS